MNAAPDFFIPSTSGLAPLPSPLRLHRGGELRGAVVAYETWGRLNPARDNAILLFTGLSPSAHAASSTANPRPTKPPGFRAAAFTATSTRDRPYLPATPRASVGAAAL